MRLWIAVAAGEAHVTIRYMYRGLALALVVAFALTACGDETSGPTQADLDEPRAAADEAAQAVDRLEAARRDARRGSGRFLRRRGCLRQEAEGGDQGAPGLARQSEGIDRRGPIQRTASAAADAEAAAAQVGAVVRDLSVLEDRFNFHLREHGG